MRSVVRYRIACGVKTPEGIKSAPDSVSVKMQGKHTLVQTDKNNGKPWRITTIEVQPDGKTAKGAWKDLRRNQSGTYVLSRQ